MSPLTRAARERFAGTMSTRPKSTNTHYGDYLHLHKLLDSQHPKSGVDGEAAHDEMLFIVIHQAYELWFKLILHELGSVVPLFKEQKLDETRMGFVVSRLERVVEIQRVLVDQLSILETMTPLDFLDFRDYLVPASGFQSVQFRLIEATLGLRGADRATLADGAAYHTHLQKGEQETIANNEKEPSLFDLLEGWLERIPFLDQEGYDFWTEYEAAVTKMLASDAEIINTNSILSDKERSAQLAMLEQTRTTINSLIDKNEYEKLQEQGLRRLSHRAMSAALFIDLYRDFPALQLPYKMLSRLVDIDELFTAWRQRHAIMVHRMIGRKIGTGGSSGHKYLQAAADKHKVFTDLFDLPTYLVQRSALPTLPESLQKRLRFNYEAQL